VKGFTPLTGMLGDTVVVALFSPGEDVAQPFFQSLAKGFFSFAISCLSIALTVPISKKHPAVRDAPWFM